MPVLITSDRPAVLGILQEFRASNPQMSFENAAREAVRDWYGLALEDGIYGGSEAALCLGYDDRGPDDNLLDEIVEDLAAEAETSAAAGIPAAV